MASDDNNGFNRQISIVLFHFFCAGEFFVVVDLLTCFLPLCFFWPLLVSLLLALFSHAAIVVFGEFFPLALIVFGAAFFSLLFFV